MDQAPHPETTPLPAGGAEAQAAGLAEAERLLDRLRTSQGERPLAEHVEVFGLVHGALVDALAQTES